jgi:hypothetical protein
LPGAPANARLTVPAQRLGNAALLFRRQRLDNVSRCYFGLNLLRQCLADQRQERRCRARIVRPFQQVIRATGHI